MVFDIRYSILIPIMIKICAFVISTGGPQSGPKWRNLLKKQISRLRFAALEMTRKAHLLNPIGMIPCLPEILPPDFLISAFHVSILCSILHVNYILYHIKCYISSELQINLRETAFIIRSACCVLRIAYSVNTSRYIGWRIACAIGAPPKGSVEGERRKIVNSQ